MDTRRRLGSDYELVARIGGGAMGEVWRATQLSSGEPVAAKLLRPEFASDREIVGRFLQERSMLLTLQHESIVKVRDLVVERDQLAIVMDLIDGHDLRTSLKESGTIVPHLAVGLVAVVLDALAAAHAQGMLHRDVKPDNVLLTRSWPTLAPGTVLLSDFGVARFAQQSTVMATGLLGTPAYMPPELIEEGKTSAAADVWSAGIMLYELLAGRTPFAGEGTAMTVGLRAVRMEPPPLDVPDALWQVLMGMLAKSPAQRLRVDAAASSLRELMPSLTTLPRLPRQDDPQEWRPSADLGRHDTTLRGPLHTSEAPADVDPGRTNLDVAFVPEQEAAASTGAVRGLVEPSTDTGMRGAETYLGVAPSTYAPPVLVPEVAPLPPAKTRNRRRWLVLALALVLVVGAVGAFLILRGGSDPAPSAQDDTTTTSSGGGGDTGGITAQSSDERNDATGLTISRSATWDPDSKSATVTIDYKTDSVALAGPFFQVLPAVGDGGSCPLPVWDGAQADPNNKLTTGITTDCGYAVDIDSLQPGDTTTVTATVQLALEGNPQEALQDWLDGASSDTTDALDAAAATNQSYPAQRLQDVQVDAPALVSVKAKQLQVRLLPVWASGVDTLHPLFDTTSGATTTLLDKVAGGLSSVRLYQDCQNGIEVDSSSLSISVVHASDSCFVVASVGNLSDLRSNEFTISGAGS